MDIASLGIKVDSSDAANAVTDLDARCTVCRRISGDLLGAAQSKQGVE